jgi:putative heme-binding domain-containing protein
MWQVSDLPGTAPVYPISPDLPRFNDYWALHRFTSANSVIVYRDDLFGPQFYGNSFVSEPVGNLVHREVLRRDSVLFHSSRAADEQKSEFLASFDGWCRPTMLRVGPDGALWVADMYRLVIEHPEWIPKEWQAKLDLRAGHDKGRIYRIYPVGTQPRVIPRLDKLDVAGLVAALDSPSGWQRDMVQQLLVQRHEMSAVTMLEQAAIHAKRDVTRLHALCTLDGLRALRAEILKAALADPQGGVRRHAVRLSEPLLNKNADLGPLVLKLVSDPDPQVRMQVAYSLGEWDDRRAGEALGRLAFDSRDDQYVEAATMTSLTKANLEPVLTAFLHRLKGASPAVSVLSNLLRFAQATGNDRATVTVIDVIDSPSDGKLQLWQLETIRVLLDTLDSSRAQPGNRLATMLRTARSMASDASTPQDVRVAAVRLLGSEASDRQADLSVLASLLTPQIPADLQTAGITTLSRMRDSTAPHVLLLDWKTYSPGLRVQVLDALLNRPEWAGALLDAMDQKLVLPSDFDAIRRQRLVKVADSSVRERATKFFQSTAKPDRQQVVDAFQPALKLEGSDSRGAQVFAKTCIPCHRFGGVGNAVGPDLASIGDKSPETLLVSILDPNRAVEPKYVAYIVQTKDGQTLSGVLGEETATSITFLQANIPPLQILRTEITQLHSTGLSLMPDGLESGLSQQDIADLIAHVRSGGQPAKPKEFAGNHPTLVMPAPDGSILLKATSCEMYGHTLVFEQKFQNLGYWHSDDDSAVWTISPQKADRYDVWLDYSCDKSAAGNMYLLQAGPATLIGPINATGDWEQFRRIKLGQISLPAGTQKITFRSNGSINGYLCDLRLVELLPVDIPMLPGRR